MGSLISAAQKAGLESVMNDLHDTWKLPLKAFKEQEQIFISTNPNYSSAYQAPVGLQTSTPVERSFEARIYYVPKGLELKIPSISEQDALRLALSEHQVRLKVLPEDYEFLKEAKRLQIDDNVYSISSAERPHGLFSSKFYTIYLKKLA